MHEIERLPLPIRSGVREQIFHVLAHFASGGNHGPIPIKRLFLMAADGLVKAGIIERPDSLGGKGLGGQSFVEAFDRQQQQPKVFPNYGIPGDIVNLMRQTFWELYLQGVLAPASKGAPPILGPHIPHEHEDSWLHFDSVMLTPYGVHMLIDSRSRIQVHDPDGYLANFWNASPPPDPEMMRYLCECISVFRSGHLLACVVLLGIASERLIEVLAKSLRDALGSPRGGAWFDRNYRNKRNISDRFQAIDGKLMGEYGNELADEKLKDAFQGLVTLTFEEIRHARNEIAHPQGREFTWNEVSGFLHNFVQYFRYINKIISFLANRS